jgi:hypothetical protein
MWLYNMWVIVVWCCMMMYVGTAEKNVPPGPQEVVCSTLSYSSMYPCSKTVYILVEILVSHIFPNISRMWLDGSAVIHKGLDHLRFGDWIGSTDRLCIFTLDLDLIFWAANWGSSSSEDNSCDPSFWLVIFPQLRQTAVKRPAEQSPVGRRPPPSTGGRFWCKPHLDKLFWCPLRFWAPV